MIFAPNNLYFLEVSFGSLNKRAKIDNSESSLDITHPTPSKKTVCHLCKNVFLRKSGSRRCLYRKYIHVHCAQNKQSCEDWNLFVWLGNDKPIVFGVPRRKWMD